MTILDHFPHTCEIQERHASKNRIKSNVHRYLPVRGQGSVTCWVQPASADEIERFSRPEHKITHKVYFVEDPNLQSGMRIIYDGRTFEVRGAMDGTLELGVVWTVFCEELGSEQ